MTLPYKPPYPRYRVKPMEALPSSTETWERWGTTPVSQTFPGTGTGSVQSVQTWDVVTPNFRRIVDAGGIINSPFTSIKDSKVYNAGTCTRTYVASPPPYPTGSIWRAVRNSNRMGLQGYSETAYVTDRLKSLAATSCLAKVGKPTADLGVTLAQYKQTLSLVKLPIAATQQYLKGLLSGKGTLAALNVGAGVHLAWIFGVVPLMEDTANVLSTIGTVPPQRNTARSAERDDYEQSYTWTFTGGGATGPVQGLYRRTVVVRAGCLWEWDVVSKSWLLGLENIPRILWDGLTFSFVVDWWINVGKYIYALTPNPYVHRLASWITIRDTKSWVETLGNLTSTDPAWSAVGGGDSSVRILETVTREPNDLSGLSGIRFKGKPMNQFQIDASVSLVIQLLYKVASKFGVRTS